MRGTFGLNTKEKPQHDLEWERPWDPPREPPQSGDGGSRWTRRHGRRRTAALTRPPRGARGKPTSTKRTPELHRGGLPGRGGVLRRRTKGPRAESCSGTPRRSGTPGPRRGRVRPSVRPPARPLSTRVPGASAPPPRSSRARTGVLAPRPPPSLKPPAQAASYLRPPPPRLTAPRAAARAATAARPAPAPAASPPPSWLRSEVTSGGAGRGLRSPRQAHRRGGLRTHTPRRPRAARSPMRGFPEVPGRGRPGLNHELFHQRPAVRTLALAGPALAGTPRSPRTTPPKQPRSGRRHRLAASRLSAPKGWDSAQSEVITRIRSLS